MASGCSAVPWEIAWRAAALLTFCAPLLVPIISLSASSTDASVSTYSGTPSRSRSAGSTNRCSTRRTVLLAGLDSLIDASGRELGPLDEVRPELVLEHRQRRSDRHVHVEVLVGAEPAAEEHHRLPAGPGPGPQHRLPLPIPVVRGGG